MQQWPDKTRVPSPYRSPNEGRKKKKICGKMRFYLVQKWTFEKLNPGEDFQSAECRVDCFFVCDVAETSSTNRPPQSLIAWLCLCSWHETWGATSPSSPTHDHRGHSEAMARARVGVGEHSYPDRREEKRGEGRRWQSCAEEKDDFGRTFLKLCWVMIGWLPPLPFPVTDTDSRYTSFTYLTIFTLYWL